MADCPKCGAQINEDFGMVTCPGCGAFLFIDMDGVAQIQNAEPAGEMSHSNIVTSPALSNDPTPPEEHNPFPTFELPAEPPPEDEPAAINIPGFSFGDPVAEVPTARTTPPHKPPEPVDQAQPTVEVAPAVPPADDESIMDELFGSGFASPQQESAATPTGPTADDPLGLNDFANSELAAAKDGLLMYRIFISGLDTKEIRAAVRESLQDSRFAWNAARISAGTAKGSLVIDQVSSVKATILIGRIKRLPIKITWEQYAITGAESEEPPAEEPGGY